MLNALIRRYDLTAPNAVRRPPYRLHDARLKVHERTLAYTDCGDPGGIPVVFAHGMPGSRLQGLFFHHQAQRHGFRVLTLDRPGIGQSTYQAQRALLDYAEDVRALTDTLGIRTFIHMGWSSGGPRTLACAYTLPDRVRVAVILSSYTHFQELPEARTLLLKTRWPGPKIAEWSPRLFRALVALVVCYARLRPSVYMRAASQLISQNDRQILDEMHNRVLFRRDQLECLRSGSRAITKDLETELLDWGFTLNQVRTRTWVYQGEEDPFVPEIFARHLAYTLPDAALSLLTSAGHLYPLDEGFQERLFMRLKAELGRNERPPESQPRPPHGSRG